MIHKNSKKAFLELQKSSHLSRQEAIAIAEVVNFGPGTSRELDARIGHGGRAWHPTYHRLERRGVFTTTHSRTCTVSGKTAMVYEYTNVTTAPRLPPKPSRKDRRAFLVQTPVPADPALAKVRKWLIDQLK